MTSRHVRGEPPPFPRMIPTLLFGATFVSTTVLASLACIEGAERAWGIIAGMVHFGLLVALRFSLQDQFLALSLGVDAIIREERKPDVIVLPPLKKRGR